MSDEPEKKQDEVAGTQATATDALIKERDEYLNGWKRAKADLINFKKEEERRLKEVADFATLRFVQELLAGMDSFDLALAATKDEEVKKGMLMIKGQFDEILRRQGVVRIEAKIGAPPDPRLHEAIGEVDNPQLSGMIAQELVAGYRMGDRVIRATKVQVGK